MNRPILYFFVLLLIACASPKIQKAKPLKNKTNLTQIAFGSCSKQDKPQPILETVLTKYPQLFIYLGDNIYGDTEDMELMKAKYKKLESKPEFQNLRSHCMILATWDDHDYGENDAGRHYPAKAASKKVFLDFWKEPKLSKRRTHPGIYHTEFFGDKEHRVQVILLDTRTFRDDLLPAGSEKQWKNSYKPNPNPDSTFLGEKQWKWLENQLQKPAKIRIIASSNQFSHEYNGYESWTNVPHEQKKMMDLIKKTKANGVVFISGDVHWGEMSKMENDGSYPLYDITSSGITETWDSVEPNKNRIGEVVRGNNFGMITINWEKSDPELTFYLFDVTGTARVTQGIKLSEISSN